MADLQEKIISEFCLVEAGKQQLQAFLDQRFDDLRSADMAISGRAMIDLVDLIRGNPEGTGVFPAESIAELRKTFSGQSDIALLIRNCPERTGLENMEDPKPEDTYSYYLGQAIYELCHAQSIYTGNLIRQSHKKDAPFEGGFLHRDMATADKDLLPGPTVPCADHVIFACPYNGENAVIEITKLKQALSSLTAEQRQSLSAKAYYGYSATGVVHTVEEILGSLTPVRARVAASKALLTEFELIGDEAGSQALADAVMRHSATKNLQPGDLLVIDENTTLHKAHKGDAGSIQRLPLSQAQSRMLLHMAGAARGAQSL